MMMRKRLLFSFFLMFALVLAPSLSLADDGFGGSVGGSFAGDYGVKYTTVTHDGGWTGFLVKAADSWSAAVYACGGDPARISADLRSKLSDPNYGGAFYTYATTYAHIMSVYEIPEFVPLYVLAGLGISGAWHGEFGDMMLWYADTPNSLLERAMIDFRRVLAGEDLGGSGPSDSTFIGPYTSVDVFANQRNFGTVRNLTAYNATYDDGFLVVGNGSVTVSSYTNSSYYVSSARALLSSTAVDFVNDKISSGYHVVIATSGDGCIIVYGNNLSKSYNKTYLINGSNGHYVLFRNTPSGYLYNDDVGIFSVAANNVDFNIASLSLPNTFDYMSDVITSPLSSPTSPPSGTWPEPSTPVTPDPPEVPTPTAPTVTPDPTPTEPTVVWPTAPIVVNPPEVTVEVTPTGLDYTELLTRINDNLNSIDSYAQAINSGLNSLRPDIIGGFDDVVSAIRNIYTYLQHFDSLLERHCKHIRDSIDDNVYELELYLKDLLQWLAAQLNYDNLYEYDDSTVTTLLYRILQKIPGGNGPVTYKPNPQSDEPGFFDWLSDLWHRFLIDLVSVLPDELGGLVNAFSQLTHYFPFSIPWDLFALFALFEHDPVTPVFDIPWGYGGESGDVQMIRIDLSVWDGVMSMIRPVFIVGFCFKLAMITKDLLSNFDINKGGI